MANSHMLVGASTDPKNLVIRRITPSDLFDALTRGIDDFVAMPSHAVFLCVIYPLLGIALIGMTLGNSMLPLAFPEGSPVHPSYGAGHATTAGACVTILKAFFDDTTPIVNPVAPSDDGSTLVPYTGADADQMTVGGELNKVAANVAIGRNIAGVHWRSDYVESLKLGEQIAISVLRDQRMTYAQDFEGYTFTQFDGTRITV